MSWGFLGKPMPKKVIDRTGQRFGLLTALQYMGRGKHTQSMWLCSCECGSTKVISLNALTQGGARSCGCRVRMPIDITGQRFGKLVAVRKTGESTQKGVLWLCKCDCGNESVAIGTRLRIGEVISCGCAVRDPVVYYSEKVRQKQAAHKHTRRARARSSGGVFTPSQIDSLFSLQRGRCANCGTPIKDGYHRDHKIPLVAGGSNDISNIELLCPVCNLRKSTKDPIEWASENGRLL